MSLASRVSQSLLTTVLSFALLACASTYDVNDPDVRRGYGVDYKTTLPQEFDYILYSRHGTLDASIRFTNSGTLVFGENGLRYANNSEEVSIDYDDIVEIRRVLVPVRKMSPLQRNIWLSIRYRDGDTTRKIGFRGGLARAHPWTGDRIYLLLRDTLAARGH